MKNPIDVPHGGESWNSQIQVSSVPCSFRGVAVSNKSAAAFWLWVCDSAGAGDRPVSVLYVPGLSTQGLDWSTSPRTMTNGLYVCASTDPVTRTLIAASDAFFDVAYDLLKIDNTESIAPAA